MKTHFGFSLAIAALLAGGMNGCSSYQSALVLDAVGPSTQMTNPQADHGVLLVISAYSAGFDTSFDPAYCDCRIFSAEGEMLMRVHNKDASGAGRFALVPLPSGEFRIRARTRTYGWVTAPVLISAGKVTMVDLLDEAAWPDRSTLLKSHPVRLPRGEIVGWPADPPDSSRH